MGEERQEQIWIDAPRGVRLAGVLHLPDRPAASGVLLCHGLLGTKDGPKHLALASALAARGHAALRFDFQGRGESPGDLLELGYLRLAGEARAALAVLGGLSGASRLGLVGSSMGGAAGVLLAAEERVQALVTLAGVGRADLLCDRVVGRAALARWAAEGRIVLDGVPVGYSLAEEGRRVDLPGAARRVRCPWLILHGDRDAVVLVDDARVLAEAATGRARLEIVPGADHGFTRPEHLARVVERTVGFLDAALGEEGI